MKSSILWKTVLILFATTQLWANPQPGVGRRGGMPKYDPVTEVTVKGTLKEIKEHSNPRGSTGTHLILQTETDTLEVHLGPSDFLDEKDFRMSVGDQIEVIGSRVTIRGSAALLARVVKRGEEVLTLRDAKGIPKWSGGRRRNP